MDTNLKRRDYREFHLTGMEIIVEAGKAVLIVGLLTYFFYRSIWAALPLAVVGVLFLRMEARAKKDKCREELTCQFKECILSVAAALKAGYAVENAFLESRGDMKLLYGENSVIYRELEGIRRGLVINRTLEEELADLAERSGSDEIRQFSQVLSIAKRGGGSLPDIIQSSAELISRRIETKQEIQTMLSGRRMEQNIMKLMPFGILAYIGSSYPGYFDPLYHNLQGIAVMTVCLAVYLAAYVMGDRILRKIALEMG